MASTIKLKNGSGAPLVGDLVQGEPALDLTNKRLYTEDSGGNVIEVGVNPTSITTGTITASGEITANGGIALPDSQKATFGASDDLQIYHDGSHSYIQDTDAGNLYLKSNGAEITLRDGSNTSMIRAFTGGGVRLYNNGTERLEVTSTGVDVTGTVTVASAIDTSAITISTPYGIAGEQYSALRWNNSSFAGGDSEIRNVVNGAASVGSSLEFHTEHTGTGVLTERLKLHNNGDISFYNSAGSSQSFYWDASAERLGIGTTSPSSALTVAVDDATGDNGARIVGATDGNKQLRLAYNTTGNYANIQAIHAGTAYTNLVLQKDGGNVGIGTSSPVASLDVVAGADDRLLVTSSSGDTFLSSVNAANTAYNGLALNGSEVKLFTNASERMRIDSSGNLLVGTTDGTPYASNVKGAAFYNAGAISGSVDGLPALYLNRKTSDGTIADFRKDGTTVGSIGTLGGALSIGNNTNSGILFNGTALQPTSGGTSRTDGVNNIGASAYRFKDIYLSGGVYLGGTGAANQLDDYEEGSWTPVWEGGGTNPTVTYDFQEGRYRKIGNLVFITGRFRTDSVSGGSGSLLIGGLPFSAQNTSYGAVPGSGAFSIAKDFINTPAAINIQDSGSVIQLRSDLNSSASLVSDLSAGANSNDFAFSAVYVTT